MSNLSQIHHDLFLIVFKVLYRENKNFIADHMRIDFGIREFHVKIYPSELDDTIVVTILNHSTAYFGKGEGRKLSAFITKLCR